MPEVQHRALAATVNCNTIAYNNCDPDIPHGTQKYIEKNYAS